MGALSRWTALASLAVAAGAAGAAAASRRRRAPMPARTAAGVDGLGEPARLEPAPVGGVGGPGDARPPASPAADEAAGGDAIAALDAARDRLRRRAEDLRREIGAGGA